MKMNLREWTSNSENFMESIPEKDWATGEDLSSMGLK